MFQAIMRCNLWDLVDEGIDDVLDRLKGEAGITGISVPLMCPPVEQLRPHKGTSPRTFRSRGGAQFQPHIGHYENTRLKPLVADWLRKSNPLPQVMEGCVKRGLGLEAELDCLQSPVSVDKYPFAGVKNVFGDPHSLRLCPNNPDVAQFLRALITDLQESFGLKQITLHAPEWSPGNRPSREIAKGDPLQSSSNAMEILRHVLNLCFCESCRQRAEESGIPSATVTRETQRGLEKLLASGETADGVAEFCEKTPGLTEYEDALLAAAKEASPDSAARGQDSYLLPIGIGVNTDSATLVRLVSEHVAMGGRAVMFDHYGSMPLSRLAWIKQAVRKAQRDLE